MAQGVFAAVEDHLGSAPGQGLLGFLVGRVLECPHTGDRYVVVDHAVRVPQVIVGDASGAVLGQSLAAVQRMVPAGEGELVGWYHSHPRGEPTPSAKDRAAHRRHFRQPWHVALVVAIGAMETKGGVFRPASDPGSAVPYLSFYEILDERLAPPGPRDNWKRSRVTWSNYRTPDPAVWPANTVVTLERGVGFPLPRAPGPVGRPASADVLIPAVDVVDDEDDDPAVRPLAPGRARRWWLAAGGVAAVLAALSTWVALVPAAPEAGPRDNASVTGPVSVPVTVPVSAPVSVPVPVSPDAVQRAIEAYGVRASLFANHQMTCADLAQGLADVDAQWLQSSVARSRASVPDDTAPTVGDRTLAQEVGTVEADFERTGCPRP